MDPQSGLASKDDLWRLQNEMRNVYATQAEHADRLMRLEQRQDNDTLRKPHGVGINRRILASSMEHPSKVLNAL